MRFKLKMIKVLKTHQDYKAAQEQLYTLVFGKETHTNDEKDQIELLKLLISIYQDQHIKLPNPKPVDAIRFRMEQMNLKQKDIAPLFGGENRASEIFNETKELSMKMVVNLHKYLGIPYNSLVQERPKYKLDSNKIKSLLKIKPIADYQKLIAR
jgi:HTH-type transcriptional regulator/antitoxin HigA